MQQSKVHGRRDWRIFDCCMHDHRLRGEFYCCYFCDAEGHYHGAMHFYGVCAWVLGEAWSGQQLLNAFDRFKTSFDLLVLCFEKEKFAG